MSDPAFRKTVLYETPAEDARNPLRLCICRFALIEGGGYRIIRHRHPEYEFMIPLDGPYESVLNGKRLLVHPGQQILIQPGDIHEDLCDGAFRFAAFRCDIVLNERVFLNIHNNTALAAAAPTVQSPVLSDTLLLPRHLPGRPLQGQEARSRRPQA